MCSSDLSSSSSSGSHSSSGFSTIINRINNTYNQMIEAASNTNTERQNNSTSTSFKTAQIQKEVVGQLKKREITTRETATKKSKGKVGQSESSTNSEEKKKVGGMAGQVKKIITGTKYQYNMGSSVEKNIESWRSPAADKRVT